MKKKNHSAWLCVVWAITTLLNALSCVNNFVDGNLWLGVLFLCVAVGFGFGTGTLFQKALEISRHNKQVEWLQEIAQELQQELVNRINPFEELDNDKKS